MRPAGYLAGSIGGSISEAGAVFMLLLSAIKRVPRAIRQKHLVVEQMQRIGLGSLPLVIVTSLFTGGVAAVQAAYQFQSYVPLRYLGMVIGKSVVIELGPVLTGLVVGGRVGASIAAELGTMKVTEQIEALETLAIDPVRYLVSPRLIAAVVMLPVITVFADFIAIMGGFAVAWAGLDINTHIYFNSLKLHLTTGDVLSGLIKSFFFGGIIAMMGCYHGMKTRGGAEGVGIATTKAVVSSCLLILVTDYILASLLFSAVFAG
jgi:phospholipid/cholesterol/gamma-HCH transport system permease protein